MSYLLDALRKAERERKLGTVPDLGTESGDAKADGRRWPPWVPTVLGAVIAVNLAAVAYLAWRWQAPQTGVAAVPAQRSAEPAPAATPPEDAADESAASAQSRAPEPPATGGRTAEAADAPPAGAGTPDGDAARARSGAAEPADSPGSRATAGAGDAPPPQGTSSADADTAETAAASGTPRPGSTVGADSALVAEEPASDAALGEEVPPLQGLPAEARRDIPDIRLNGHLYSSVPGRSFVLIDGRRYHEGERLAAGGAVESIDARGVVINYEGRRFRMPAPN